MNKITKFLTILTATLLAMGSIGITPVLAVNSYTEVQGGSVTFDKYVIVDKDANVPTMHFAFQASNATEIMGDDGYVSVFDGNTRVGTPTISDAVFTSDMEHLTSVQNRDSSIDDSRGLFVPDNFVKDAVDLPEGKDYVKATATIDFSSLTFKEPGVFRWVITEVPDETMAAHGVTYSSESRYVDVYVNTKTYDEATGTGTLEITAYVFHNDADYRHAAIEDNKPADTSDYVKSKAKGFTNSFKTEHFTLKSTADGNQADHTKYFEYEVELDNLPPGTTITLGGTKYDDGNVVLTDGTQVENKTEVTSGTDGKAKFKVYLQPGQEVNIGGLPIDAKITITQDPDEYDQDMVDENGDSIIIRDENGNPIGIKEPANKYIDLVPVLDDDGNPVDKDGDGNPDVQPAFVVDLSDPTVDPDDLPDIFNNYKYKVTKEGVLPTGVLTTVIPGATLIGIAIAGAVIITRRKKEEFN